MKNRLTVLLILFLLPASGHSQIRDYARNVVNILASDSLMGRGYVGKGDSIAADFIRGEFVRLGVDVSFQHYTISINTFPEPISLKLGDTELKGGIDFLVNPSSRTSSGTFETVWMEKEDLFNDKRLEPKFRSAINKVLIIPPIDETTLNADEKARWRSFRDFLMNHPNNFVAATIFLENTKLTWFGAKHNQGRPAFMVDVNSAPKEFEKVTFSVTSEYFEAYPSQNVIAEIPGTASDSVIVLMAHYDHFGFMGEAMFPGANDNASGVAMLLSMARYYVENPPKYTMVFLSFSGEEIALLGSKYFIEHPTFDLSKTKFYLNFDLAGTGDEGIQVVNGSVYRNQFDRIQSINSANNLLPQVKIRGAACNSDHCFFDQKKLPGFYIYTLGGIRAYHDIYDKAETLPLTKFDEYFELMTQFLDGF